jgi:hypothetical protein
VFPIQNNRRLNLNEKIILIAIGKYLQNSLSIHVVLPLKQVKQYSYVNVAKRWSMFRQFLDEIAHTFDSISFFVCIILLYVFKHFIQYLRRKLNL